MLIKKHYKAEIDEIIKNTKELIRRQTEPDLPENLETIPLWSCLIEPKAVLPSLRKMKQESVHHYPITTNGIAYLNLWFDSSAVPMELIPYAGLLIQTLGKVSTRNYSYEDLAKEINNTQAVLTMTFFPRLKTERRRVLPKLLVRSKALTDNFQN